MLPPEANAALAALAMKANKPIAIEQRRDSPDWTPVQAHGPIDLGDAPRLRADAGSNNDWQAFTKTHAAHLPPEYNNLAAVIGDYGFSGARQHHDLLPAVEPYSNPSYIDENPHGTDALHFDNENAMMQALFNAYMASRSVHDDQGDSVPWAQQSRLRNVNIFPHERTYSNGPGSA